MADTLGIAVNVKNRAVTQYSPMAFTGVAVRNGVPLACGSAGIYALDSGQTDAGADIEAFIETVSTDFGSPNQKRIRSVLIGYQTDGDIKVSFKNDETNERSAYLTPVDHAGRQHKNKFFAGRDGKGGYWSFKIENVSGSDFSVDSLDAGIVLLSGKPSGS